MDEVSVKHQDIKWDTFGYVDCSWMVPKCKIKYRSRMAQMARRQNIKIFVQYVGDSGVNF